MKSFLVKTKIWDSEGFLKTRLSDASDKNYENFFQTQVNIDRIMENDQNFKKILSYEDESQKFPQSSDSIEQQTEFNSYTNNFLENQKPLYHIPTGVR